MEKESIHDLELEAKRIKRTMDSLNEAYIGLTLDEIIRLALGGKDKGGEAESD